MKKITYEQIDDACLLIAQKIKSQTPTGYTIAAVSRGGLVPAAIVSHYLGYKDIRFIRLSSYSDEKEHSGITDSTTDEIPNSENTYIIDDICDSGDTLKYLRQKYAKAQIYTLINKNPTIKPDYFPVTEQMGVWINFPWEVEDR
jgi:xanthine phosphoribosyltransferase